MQIHELPAGSPASGVQFAVDTGSQTQKIDYDALADAILNKLTTKTFDIKSESQTIIAALNALGDASKQDVANDLVTTAAGLVLDARQGKALDDKIASLNSSTSERIGEIRSRFRWMNSFNSDSPLTISSTGNGAYLLYGYLQGYNASAVILISLIGGSVTIWDVCANKAMGAPLSATYSNETLTVTTTNSAPSRVVLSAL